MIKIQVSGDHEKVMNQRQRIIVNLNKMIPLVLVANIYLCNYHRPISISDAAAPVGSASISSGTTPSPLFFESIAKKNRLRKSKTISPGGHEGMWGDSALDRD
jgi:hypothetical protein